MKWQLADQADLAVLPHSHFLRSQIRAGKPFCASHTDAQTIGFATPRFMALCPVAQTSCIIEFNGQQEKAMKFGYARVSTQDQDNQAQITALQQAGCERIFHEKASGGRWDRPELARLMEHLRPGDVLVVYKLDRLSRSLKDLLLTLEKVELAGAAFCSLTEAIDTGTPAGRMMMQIVGSFAEFERAMLRERTRNGLVEARKQGRVGGRKPSLTPQQEKEVVAMVTSGQKSGAEVARLFRVHPATVSRVVARARSWTA